MAGQTRRHSKRIRRVRQAAHNLRWPTLSIRRPAEEVERVRSAGGLGVVLAAVLAGDVMPRAEAERMAAEERVEARAIDAVGARDAAITKWTAWADEVEETLKKVNARAATAAVAVAEARQHAWNAGFEVGRVEGARQEVDRRAALVGAADAAEEREAAAAALLAVARQADWKVNWGALTRESIRQDCAALVLMRVPRGREGRFIAALAEAGARI